LGAYGQLIIYFPNNNSNYCFSDLASGKKYSAKIISSTTKIAVVQSHSSFSKRKLIEENAIPQNLSGKKMLVPRVYNNYSGWISSFTIQNAAENQNANFKVTYIKDNGILSSGNGDCYGGTISPLKSKVIYPPGLSCIPEGQNFYSAVIESTNNVDLTGLYHLAYPKTTTDPNNLSQYRSAGNSSFSEKEAGKVFFVPRIYFYSWNWQSGLVVQNAVYENNRFSLYILNDEGKILAKRENISLSNYQAKSYYIPTDFFSDLAEEKILGNFSNVSLPSDESSSSPTPTFTPAPTLTPACAKKSQGDANCDENINDDDYNIWKCEFLEDGICQNASLQKTADFNLDTKVDLVDFEIWRSNRFAPTSTSTPTQTRTQISNLSSNLPLEQIEDYIKQDFRKADNLSPKKTIDILDVNQEGWKNACLGCSSPGITYAQGTTEGRRFVLKAEKGNRRCVYTDYRVANSSLNGSLSYNYYNKNNVRRWQRVDDVYIYI
jgi:hypothetical protein